MEVNDIEARHVGEHQLHQPNVVGQRIPAVRIAPEGVRASGDELRGGRRVSAREQRHLVPFRHQLLGEVGDDPLGAAVELWGNGFVERCDLCNAHGSASYSLWFWTRTRGSPPRCFWK